MTLQRSRRFDRSQQALELIQVPSQRVRRVIAFENSWSSPFVNSNLRFRAPAQSWPEKGLDRSCQVIIYIRVKCGFPMWGAAQAFIFTTLDRKTNSPKPPFQLVISGSFVTLNLWFSFGYPTCPRGDLNPHTLAGTSTSS